MKRLLTILSCAVLAISGCSKKKAETSPAYSSFVDNAKLLEDGSCEFSFKWMAPVGASKDTTYDIYVSSESDPSKAMANWTLLLGKQSGTTAKVRVSGDNYPMYFYVAAAGKKPIIPSHPEEVTSCKAEPKEDPKPQPDVKPKSETPEQNDPNKNNPKGNGQPAGDLNGVGTSNSGTGTGNNANVCSSIFASVYGDKAYSAFGIPEGPVTDAISKSEVCNLSSAYFPFEVYDDPVLTIDRDILTPTDKCDAASYDKIKKPFSPKPDYLHSQGSTATAEQFVPGRILVSSRKNAKLAFLTRSNFDKDNPFTTMTFKVFNDGDESVDYDDIKTKVFEVVQKNFETVTKTLEITVEDKAPLVKINIAGEEDEDESPSIKVAGKQTLLSKDSVLNKEIRNCGVKRILIGKFEIDHPVYNAWPKYYQAGFVVQQLHPNQEEFAGLLIDTDIVINLKHLETDYDKLEKQLLVLVPRLILLSLGAEGVWDKATEDKQSLLSNTLFSTDTFPNIPGTFDEKSLEAMTLLNLYKRAAERDFLPKTLLEYADKKITIQRDKPKP